MGTNPTPRRLQSPLSNQPPKQTQPCPEGTGRTASRSTQWVPNVFGKRRSVPQAQGRRLGRTEGQSCDKAGNSGLSGRGRALRGCWASPAPPLLGRRRQAVLVLSVLRPALVIFDFSFFAAEFIVSPFGAGARLPEHETPSASWEGAAAAASAHPLLCAFALAVVVLREESRDSSDTEQGSSGEKETPSCPERRQAVKWNLRRRMEG